MLIILEKKKPFRQLLFLEKLFSAALSPCTLRRYGRLAFQKSFLSADVLLRICVSPPESRIILPCHSVQVLLRMPYIRRREWTQNPHRIFSAPSPFSLVLFSRNFPFSPSVKACYCINVKQPAVKSSDNRINISQSTSFYTSFIWQNVSKHPEIIHSLHPPHSSTVWMPFIPELNVAQSGDE